MTTRQGTAVLYRMAMPGHLCPWGLKALDLLRRKGFTVEDHLLTTREAVDAFRSERGVATTPQVFTDGARIGGYDDLRRHLGLTVRDPKGLSYGPVIAVFAAAGALALAVSQATYGTPFTLRAGEWSVAFLMVLLGMLKLRDVAGFSTMFLNYDLLAQRWVPYATFYPFAEFGAGLLMAAGVLMWASVPVVLFIGTVGALSVIKAVYVEGRALKCACVGGDSNVPLGFLSLTENLLMVAMTIWMLSGAGAAVLH